MVLKGKKPLIFIGLNPSTANSEKPDRTITKVLNFTENFGYDSFIMINLYPFRTPYPSQLPAKLDLTLHSENIKQIKKLLKKYKKPDIVACWGAKINARPYLLTCYQEIFKSIKPLVGNVYSLGKLTKHGHPRHPSRISYKNRLNNFKCTNYNK